MRMFSEMYCLRRHCMLVENERCQRVPTQPRNQPRCSRRPNLFLHGRSRSPACCFSHITWAPLHPAGTDRHACLVFLSLSGLKRPIPIRYHIFSWVDEKRQRTSTRRRHNNERGDVFVALGAAFRYWVAVMCIGRAENFEFSSKLDAHRRLFDAQDAVWVTKNARTLLIYTFSALD